MELPEPHVRKQGVDGFEFFDPALNDFQRACNKLTENARVAARKKSGLTWPNQSAADEHVTFIKANT